MHQGLWERVPPVVMRDGIWLTVRGPIGEEYVDTRGRQRQRRQRRHAVLADAVAVYRGEDAGEIRRRATRFRTVWAEKEPQAVATLERAFDQTLAYPRVLVRARERGEVWRVTCVRTTSPLERVQRHVRQKHRQGVIAHAESGIVVRHRLGDPPPRARAPD